MEPNLTFKLHSLDLLLKHYAYQNPASHVDTSSFDITKLCRTEKAEVLGFINGFINKYSFYLNLNPANYISQGQKVERMIFLAPINDSREITSDWIIQNWRFST
jgi:hypothetical protein